MSCIDFIITPVDDCPDFDVIGTGEVLEFSVDSYGSASDFQTSEIGDLMEVKVSPVGEAMDFRCSLICWTGGDRWLRVTPEEVVWLTEDNAWSAYYEVESNISWEVTINE